ncbi:uncharacterized protein LOC142166868 [Nicotiana tabacum]|uniref:Uncharacterized protein LOC142166868 n=1 Tax=Nicotiana tabacum TaxID=4097 RepID=A0AC58SC73_TOBAC
MTAPPNFEEGQSTYRPPRFNEKYYGWWKTRMHDFIMAEDSELWDVICDEPFVLTKNLGDPTVAIPKTRKEFNDADRKAIEKNFRAKKILVCGIGPDKYNKISACQSAKEIWEALQTAHEGTTQVKQSKIDMLTTEYELFKMKDDESIQDMHTRFTSIINELHSLGETIPRNKLVRKILSVLPSSWKIKVNAITEAKDLQILTIDELGDSSSESEEENDHGDSSMMETIENLKKEKDALDEKIAHIEHERDDLMVDVVDLKETFECVRKEKEILAERVANIEHERDDLLVMVVDLKETIREPKIESRPENSQKVKAIASKAHINLETLQGGSVCFGNGNKGYILGVGRIGKSVSHSIENVYYVNGLKYSLLSVSQVCNKGNKNGDLNYLSAIDNDVELWHRRLGHASFTLLNKLVRKDLVRGLPKSSFKDHKVCDACIKGKQVRSSFKPKKEVSTSRSLDLLHMDLCRPMRVASRGGKKYIFVIVDDYTRFTWTLFLRTKDKTFEVFVAFVKRIQVKMGNNVACFRSDHGTEFDNAKFDEFCTENGITHSFLAPRNGVVERKNRTLENMARTLKAYKVYNKKTQCVEESIHVIFDESHLPYKKDRRVDQDGESLSVPGEVNDMANGKADMMSNVKESSEDDANTSPSIGEEPGPTITTSEAEN